MECLFVKADLSNFTEVISREHPIERSKECLDKDEFKVYRQWFKEDSSGNVIKKLRVQWYLQEGGKLSCEEIWESV